MSAAQPHGAPLDFSKALTAEAWLPHLAGIDAVINAVGVARQRRPAAASHACRRPHRVRRLRGGGRAAGGADLGPGHRAQRHALRQHQARRRRASAGADGAGAVERLRAASQRGALAGGASSQLFLALARLPALLRRARCCKRACSPWPRDPADAVARVAGSDAPSGLVEIGGPEAPAAGAVDRQPACAQMGHRPASAACPAG